MMMLEQSKVGVASQFNWVFDDDQTAEALGGHDATLMIYYRASDKCFVSTPSPSGGFRLINTRLAHTESKEPLKWCVQGKAEYTSGDNPPKFTREVPRSCTATGNRICIYLPDNLRAPQKRERRPTEEKKAKQTAPASLVLGDTNGGGITFDPDQWHAAAQASALLRRFAEAHKPEGVVLEGEFVDDEYKLNLIQEM